MVSCPTSFPAEESPYSAFWLSRKPGLQQAVLRRTYTGLHSESPEIFYCLLRYHKTTKLANKKPGLRKVFELRRGALSQLNKCQKRVIRNSCLFLLPNPWFIVKEDSGLRYSIIPPNRVPIRDGAINSRVIGANRPVYRRNWKRRRRWGWCITNCIHEPLSLMTSRSQVNRIVNDCLDKAL